MESVLKKVNELEKALQKELDVQSAVTAEGNELVAKNKEARKLLAEKAKDLNARELAIKPIEDISEFKTKADLALKDAKKKLKEVGLATDALTSKKAEFGVFISENKSRIAKEDARILDENKGVKKGYEQLKKAEDESDKKLVNNFIKKIKK